MKVKVPTMRVPIGKTGKFRIQHYKVLKNGKRKFIKNPSKSSSKRKGNPSKNTKRRKNKNMGKKKKRRNGNHLTATAMKFIRIGALMTPAIAAATEPGDIGHKFRLGMRLYTGYSIKEKKFRFSDLAAGWTPYLMSVLVTRGIQKISGILRRL